MAELIWWRVWTIKIILGGGFAVKQASLPHGFGFDPFPSQTPCDLLP
ncbi:hypothetical protein [Stappia sp. MMSF_3263]|nr:hypothetical protein [Stappia sp. MMSF_3263]